MRSDTVPATAPHSVHGERWLPVPGLEVLYEVSDFGRVRSLDRVIPTRGRYGSAIQRLHTGRVLSPSTRSTGGYAFTKVGGRVRLVHHLVLEAFVGARPSGLECRHLNGNPADNRLVNLAWGTPQENYEDQVRHGTARAILCPEQVREIRRLRAERVPVKLIARRFGVSDSAVYRVTNGDRWPKVEGARTARPYRVSP